MEEIDNFIKRLDAEPKQLEKLEMIYDICEELFAKKDGAGLAGINALLIALNDRDRDNNELKTLMVITKCVKDHPLLKMNRMALVITYYQIMMGHKRRREAKMEGAVSHWKTMYEDEKKTTDLQTKIMNELVDQLKAKTLVLLVLEAGYTGATALLDKVHKNGDYTIEQTRAAYQAAAEIWDQELEDDENKPK